MVAVTKEILSVKEAAELLDRSEATIYRWIRTGKLPTSQPGRSDDAKSTAGGAIHLINRRDVLALCPPRLVSAYEAEMKDPSP